MHGKTYWRPATGRQDGRVYNRQIFVTRLSASIIT